MNPENLTNNIEEKIFSSKHSKMLTRKIQFGKPKANRILLIEDDVDMSTLLQYSLGQEYSCRVDIAADPFEAMNMMTDNFYNLIILDWNLPAFDGGETLMKTERAMALEPMLPIQWDVQEVPVVVLSSSTKMDCPLKKTKHFNYVGFVSKAQPLKKIVGLLADFIEDRAVPKYWAS